MFDLVDGLLAACSEAGFNARLMIPRMDAITNGPKDSLPPDQARARIWPLRVIPSSRHCRSSHCSISIALTEFVQSATFVNRRWGVAPVESLA